MNRIQKSAWFTIVCTGAGLILSCIATAILYSIFGFPGALAGMAFTGLAGFSGIGMEIFKKDPGIVAYDERDSRINFTATTIAFVVSYFIFILLCMGVFFTQLLQGSLTVNIYVLPMILMFAGIIPFFIHALTILILYRRDKTFKGETK